MFGDDGGVSIANAFEFLEQLESSWELVRESVSELEWKSIEKARENGGVQHVVVYDANVAQVLPNDLERAEAHYGVSLTAEELLSA